MANRKLRAPSRQTLAEAAEEFLAGAEAGRIRLKSGRTYKPSTLRSYRADLARYVLPELGAAKLSEIERRALQRLVDDLLDAGFSGSKARNVVTPIKVIFRLALEADEVTTNPTANVRFPPLGDPRDRAASPAEAQCLLDALPEAERALWATAFYGGLRRGELRALRCLDVDRAGGEIHVRRSWDDLEGEIGPKSKAGARVVPIPETLGRYLRAHEVRTGRRGDDLVFGRTATSPFAPNTVRRRAERAWAVAAVGAFLTGQPLPVEIDLIGLHECRHTYVSLMHAARRSLEEIGEYVGHSSAYMTDRYRHLLDGTRAQAAAALDAFLESGVQTGVQSR